ncbi:MAG: DUF393 domain-containing protein [Candidatus Omnitrophica bacterium]|nr:DUF393 domain-containing protein [Candidatus Omnitrophota bacterium]
MTHLKANSIPVHKKCVFVRETGIVYTRSTAVLHILKCLGWTWKMMVVLIIIPSSFIRDFIYDKIAQHRYRLFGPCDSYRGPVGQIFKNKIKGINRRAGQYGGNDSAT